MEGFSAIGALFARDLSDHLRTGEKDQPVAAATTAPVLGMIQSAFGGSSVEAWIKTNEGEKILPQ